MKTIYKLSGMHCQSCVAKLSDALNGIVGVESAKVTLDPPQAIVEGHGLDSDQVVQTITSAGDYSAEEVSTEAVPTKSATATKSKLATYYPLILIVSFLIFGSVILQFRSGHWDWMYFMSDFMGGFFVVFGFFKLLDLRGFATAYQTYDIIAAKSPKYAIVYPFIEVALGAAYLMRFELFWVNVITLVVMLIGSIGVLQSVLQKRKIRCACLGTVFELPMTTVTVVEDVGMAAMAAIMIAIT
ncbi:MAG: heavy-metal-associated domain-containing protein [Pirellulaceae bacterium]